MSSASISTASTSASRPAPVGALAPEWATITDGESTCVTGERNSAPAVVTAWNHFYDNTGRPVPILTDGEPIRELL